MLKTALLALAMFVVAVLYSSVGHAGASGYLAVMALAGTSAAVMKPTALVLNLLVASIGTVRFVQAKAVPWNLLWPFAITSIPAAFIGGAVGLPGDVYKRILGAVLLISAVRMVVDLWRQKKPLRKPPALPVCLGVGAAIGFVAGLTGTGGGIFLSPIMLLMRWADPRKTAGVAAPFILVNSAAGLAGNLMSVKALPAETFFWALAVAVGAVIGSELGARRLPLGALRLVLGVVLTIAGVKLLFLI